MLQDHAENYRVNDGFTPVLRESLLTSEGSVWREHRHIVEQSFHRQRLSLYVDLMREKTKTLLTRWETVAGNDGLLDLNYEFKHLAIDILGKTLFGVKLRWEYVDDLLDAVDVISQETENSLWSSVDWRCLFPSKHNLRVRKALAIFEDLAQMIFAGARGSDADSGQESLLCSALRDVTHSGNKDQQMTELFRNEIITIFLTGHDTVANVLVWFWYLLDQHALVEQRVLEEIDRGLLAAPLRLMDLDKMPYLRMVLDEAMRLFPPVCLLLRIALGEDELGGYHIPAGSLILISPYVMHRHPAYWDRPNEFIPERFDVAAPRSFPRYTYFPFGAGRHVCIGQHFAILEMIVIVITVMQEYRIHVLPKQTVQPRLLVTMGTDRPVRAKLEKRHNRSI